MTHELWTALNGHIFTFLRSVTLAELVRQQQQKAEVVVLQDHRLATPGARPPAAVAV